jgi:hypothetical protein
VLGLDLSTRAAALVAVPANWNGDWSLVRRLVIGEPLPRGASDHDRALRTMRIADQSIEFARDYHVGSAWFESYAYGGSTNAHTLGELGGVVRARFVQAGIPIYSANMSSARKLLLGRIPRGKGAVKAAVYRTLRGAGAELGPSATAYDVGDAFVCANWGLSELGCYCFVQEEPLVARVPRRATVGR